MKSYRIIYTSGTGNTGLLANKLYEILPADSDKRLQRLEEAEENIRADLVFIGFWVDKGTCGEQMTRYLTTIHRQKVFFFGTAGMGGSEQYFSTIISAVRQLLPEDNQLAGSFLCQGRMPLSVRNRYESMLEHAPGNQKFREMLENFDHALDHPNEADLQNLTEAVRQVLEDCGT